MSYRKKAYTLICLSLTIFLFIGCGQQQGNDDEEIESEVEVDFEATLEAAVEVELTRLAEEAEDEPEVAVEEVPLPELVAQGAPGNREGIEGDVFTFKDLPLQADPAIYEDKMTFMVIGVFDKAVGENEGDGVVELRFEIRDPDDSLVHTFTADAPIYCAFGGGEDFICDIHSFIDNDNKWPNGLPAKEGLHDVDVFATGVNPDSRANWVYEFELRLSNAEVAIDVFVPSPAAPIEEIEEEEVVAVDEDDGQLRVQINRIWLSDNNYAVDFETFNYEAKLPDHHIHFFYNTVEPWQAGAPGDGPWQIYPTEQGVWAESPFTLFGPWNTPDGATQICALVANPDHSVIQESGNCVDLP